MQTKIDISGISCPATSRRANDKSVAVGEDRIGIREIGGTILVFLADGATGSGFGGIAADAFMDGMEEATLKELKTPHDCVAYLLELDEDVAVKTRSMGDTTGIVIVTDGQRLWGASAGDSAAYLYGNTAHELTGRQQKRPRIGNGAFPVGFGGYVKPGDVALMASDALLNFASGEITERICRSGKPAREIVACLEAEVRNRYAKLPDDFSVVVLKF